MAGVKVEPGQSLVTELDSRTNTGNALQQVDSSHIKFKRG